MCAPIRGRHAGAKRHKQARGDQCSDDTDKQDESDLMLAKPIGDGTTGDRQEQGKKPAKGTPSSKAGCTRRKQWHHLGSLRHREVFEVVVHDKRETA